jgi:hypothetical protein
LDRRSDPQPLAVPQHYFALTGVGQRLAECDSGLFRVQARNIHTRDGDAGEYTPKITGVIDSQDTDEQAKEEQNAAGKRSEHLSKGAGRSEWVVRRWWPLEYE